MRLIYEMSNNRQTNAVLTRRVFAVSSTNNMFSKITSDLSGASDCCNIIPPAQFKDQKCLSYLIPGEIPYMVLVSKKDEHMLTNFAYVYLDVSVF
jgi:hypothetical protein